MLRSLQPQLVRRATPTARVAAAAAARDCPWRAGVAARRLRDFRSGITVLSADESRLERQEHHHGPPARRGWHPPCSARRNQRGRQAAGSHDSGHGYLHSSCVPAQGSLRGERSWLSALKDCQKDCQKD